MKGEKIHLKRVYNSASPDDGYRILVERLWPRGLTKEKAAVDLWLKEIAPSPELRKWFGHDPARWEEFQSRYFSELDGKAEALRPIREAALRRNVTLVYGARDQEHNDAVALKAYLERTGSSAWDTD